VWRLQLVIVCIIILIIYRQYFGSGSRIRCLFDTWIRDPGWVKSQDPDPGSRINYPDHIFKSLETIFWVKILKFSDADPGPGWKKFGSGIRDGKKSDLGSGIRKNIPDPQHCIQRTTVSS
jgi:hypothetical protein